MAEHDRPGGGGGGGGCGMLMTKPTVCLKSWSRKVTIILAATKIVTISRSKQT